jgi:hypothetical protein
VAAGSGCRNLNIYDLDGDGVAAQEDSDPENRNIHPVWTTRLFRFLPRNEPGGTRFSRPAVDAVKGVVDARRCGCQTPSIEKCRTVV